MYKIFNSLFQLFAVIILITNLCNYYNDQHTIKKLNYSSNVENDALFKRVIDNDLNSVVKLNYTNEQNILFNIRSKTISATGFSIKYNAELNESYVITNDHFCSNELTFYPGQFTYQNSDIAMGNNYISGTLEVIAKDSSLDLCLLKASGLIPPLKLAQNDYVVNQLEAVKIIGAPTGVFPIIINSQVSNLLEHNHLPGLIRNEILVLLISSMFLPGQSGSPVINSNKEVIGIFFVCYPNQYGGGALHINALHLFLLENDFII